MSGLPEGWELVELHDIVSFQNGKGHEKFIDDNGEYIVVNSKFVSTNGEIFKSSYENLSPLNIGDITLVMSDIPNGKALAKCFLIQENNKYTLNQRICALTPKSDNSLFLFYKLNRNEYFLKFNDGVSQTNLRKNEVLECPIELPPLEEQKKIADILSTVDQKIDLIDTQINDIGVLKKGLMQKLLTQGIGHSEFKESEIGRIPVGWEVVKLSEICSKVIEKNKDTTYVNVLTNSATLGVISQSEYFDREIVTEKNLINYFVVSKSDYIYNPRISTTAPCGPVNQCKKYEKGIASPLYTVFRKEKNIIINDYLEFYFLSNFWNKYIKDNSNTGARHDRLSISDKLFFNMPIPLPPLEEQKQIAQILSTTDEKLSSLQEKKEAYKTLKKGLMQKLLTGEVRV